MRGGGTHGALTMVTMAVEGVQLGVRLLELTLEIEQLLVRGRVGVRARGQLGVGVKVRARFRAS